MLRFRKETGLEGLMRKRSLTTIAVLLVCFLTLAFSVGFASASVGFSDEFPTSSLNSGWTTVDPHGGSTFDLTTQPGWLIITSPADYDLGGANNYAPRIIQPVSGDFTITTKVSGSFTQWAEGAGLLIWVDSSNFIRLERREGQNVQILANINGVMQWNTVAIPSNYDPTYLKLVKTDTSVTGYWSSDGVTWASLIGSPYTFSETDVNVGLLVINVGHAGSFSASFDYFTYIDNNLQVLPEAPLNAIVLPIAVLAAFATFKFKPWTKAAKYMTF